MSFMLSVNEVAILLNKSRATIYRYIKQGSLKSHEIRKSGKKLIKISREELENFQRNSKFDLRKNCLPGKAEKRKYKDNLSEKLKKLLSINTKFDITSSEGLEELISSIELREAELKLTKKKFQKISGELRAIKKKYSTFYDFVPVGYFSIDKKGIIIESNLTAASMLEIKRRKLIGKNFLDYIIQDDQHIYFSYLNKFFKSRRAVSCEIRLKKEDNTEFYAFLKSIAVRDDKGNFLQGRITVSDISGYKLAQKSLYYRLAMEKLITGISSGFININSDEVEYEIKNALKKIGRFVDVDRCYIYLFSYDSKKIISGYEWHSSSSRSRKRKIIGSPMDQFAWSMKKYKNLEPLHISRLSELPPEAEIERQFWKNSGVLSILSFPLFLRRKLIGILGFIMEKEEKFWKVEDMNLLRLLGEIFINVLEYKRAEEELDKYHKNLEELVKIRTAELLITNQKLQEEINERKNAEEVLRMSENNFRNLYEEYMTFLIAIPDMVLVISPEMKLLWVNNVVLTAFSIKSIDTSKTCYELFCDYNSPCKNCPAIRSFSTGKIEEGEIKTPVGKYLSVKANPIKDHSGQVSRVIIIASDITEKTILQKEAVRSSHLASLGELAAGVAHEINNPINSIINYAQIIVNKSLKESRENFIAGEIISEGDRIAHIVKSLLSFSRRESRAKFPASIKEIFSDTMALAGIQIVKDGITLRVNLPDNLPAIMAQPVQIQQVFLNILSNAQYALNQKYEANHEDKIIDVYGEEITLNKTPGILIIFKDYGCGIPSSIQDKLMEPFFSTKPLGKGTGLGLSISYGIIEDHKGKIVINSEEGEFTEVKVYLPVSGKEDYS